MLNNWGTAALQGNLPGPDNRLTAGYAAFQRVTTIDTMIRGDGPNETHTGILLNAADAEVIMNHCDLRSGGAYNLGIGTTMRGPTVSLTRCELGALTPSNLNNWPSSVLTLNPGPQSVSGGTMLLDNCTFSNYRFAAVNLGSAATSVDALACVFNSGANSTDLPDYTIYSVDPVNTMTRKSTINGCVMLGPVLRHVQMCEGQDLRITNTSITGQRGAAIRFLDNTGGQPATTISLVTNVIDTGSTITADANPAALWVDFYGRPFNLIVNRNSIRGVYTGATTPSLIQRGSAARMARVRDGQISIVNNVIEGSDFAVVVSPNDNGTQNSVNLYNNTIVGLSDLASAIAVYVEGTNNQVPVLRNNVILGYPTLTNDAGPTLGNNSTATSPAPFISPYPYAAPATPGVSDYHLRADSGITAGSGTVLAAFNVDRDGVTRPTTASLWSRGAYQHNPGVNPVTHWNWFN
jgi:hypothetical protein